MMVVEVLRGTMLRLCDSSILQRHKEMQKHEEACGDLAQLDGLICFFSVRSCDSCSARII
jgi:hypothetical protein